ncbi:MAG: superoxide dismutase [Anaerolineae bacterium]
MQLLALEHEQPGTTAFDFTLPLLRDEARTLWALVQAGIMREAWFREDQHTAVLMLECASAKEAQAHLDTLPLVAAGLITFEVLPLTPYDGFARLFEE